MRWKVFAEELDLLAAPPPAPREVDALDMLETTLHFVAYAGGEPVGTARLLLTNPDLARLHGTRFGLDIEGKFDLSQAYQPACSFAEATRLCVLAPFRCSSAFDELILAMRRESQRRGVTHWIAAANVETDSEEDACLAYRISARLGLVSESFHALPLEGTAPPALPRFPLYTPEEHAHASMGDLRALRLPRVLSVLARRLDARFIGKPRYDARFRRFAMPLIAQVNRGAHARQRPSRLAVQHSSPA
ncbi:GNAT family N-acetyltransferase [Sorangium sp. So ce1036]|uniref:GNAT family N-acetyltransferase n=1 Tax=Sorangium sp. So ce1036 TaxID=3133328 RepID=UPI003F01DFCB